MSAGDWLQPQQFGPNGKYTVKQVGRRHVEAVHTNSGRRVGAMNWLPTALNDTPVTSKAGLTVEPGKPTIFKAIVSKPHRGKGVATEMLTYARQLDPDLQHSVALSDDAVRWAKRAP